MPCMSLPDESFPAGGIGKYPSGLFWGVGDLLRCGANVETTVALRGPTARGRASGIPDIGKELGDVPKRAV